jgi:hypothetical protein
MPLQQFSLVVDRPVGRALRRHLGDLTAPPRVECGPDGTQRLAFDRPAAELIRAVALAISEVEAAGLRVVRVDDRDWVTLADVAARIGRSREAVRLWALGRQGPGGFPPPLNPGMDTTFYSWAAVSPWLRERMGYDLPDDEPVLVATNLALQLRALAPRIREMHLIRGLLAG